MSAPGSDGGFAALVAGSVHDAKNALAIVLQRLDDLAARSDDRATQAEIAETQDELKRVNQMLVRLLTWYKLGEQRYALDFADCAVADLFDELQLSHRAVLALHKIELSCEADGDLEAYFDFNLVSGVVGNALSNAARHARSRVRLAAEAADGGVVLSVEDDGPGYPAALLNGQGGDESGFADGNTGLGLRFAEVVASVHRRGSLRGRSSCDNHSTLGGARWRLYLP